MRYATYALSLIIIGVLGIGLWMVRSPSGVAETPEASPRERLVKLERRIQGLAQTLGRLGQEPAFQSSALPEALKTLTERLRLTSNRIYSVRDRLSLDDAARPAALEVIAGAKKDLDDIEGRVAAFQKETAPLTTELRDAFSRTLRVHQILTYFVEQGIPCVDEQRLAEEHRKNFEQGRRWWLAQVAAVLQGNPADPRIATLGAAAIRNGAKTIDPLYERLNPVFIQVQQILTPLMGIRDRITWAEGLARRLPRSDPWRANPNHDPKHLKTTFEALEASTRAVAKSLLPLTERERRQKVEAVLKKQGEFLSHLNRDWITKAKEVGYPLPKTD
ncbi:MAG TPA: hypothetical protein ENK43_02045 [Planctomycetes bacterium]|nr:hypothetical protein [Planctomycetota bacterium]